MILFNKKCAPCGLSKKHGHRKVYGSSKTNGKSNLSGEKQSLIAFQMNFLIHISHYFLWVCVCVCTYEPLKHSFPALSGLVANEGFATFLTLEKKNLTMGTAGAAKHLQDGHATYE